MKEIKDLLLSIEDNKEYIKEYIKENQSELSNLLIGQDINQKKKILQILPEEVKNNKFIILELIKQNGISVLYNEFSNSIKEDKDIVIACMQTGNHEIVWDISNHLKNDYDIAIEAVQHNAFYSFAFPPRIYNSHLVFIRSLVNDPKIYNGIGYAKIKNMREVEELYKEGNMENRLKLQDVVLSIVHQNLLNEFNVIKDEIAHKIDNSQNMFELLNSCKLIGENNIYDFFLEKDLYIANKKRKKTDYLNLNQIQYEAPLHNFDTQSPQSNKIKNSIL